MSNIYEQIKEHNKNIQKKTMSVKEWAEVEGISYAKALKFTHAKDFPVIKVGRDRRIIISRLDDWFVKSIGINI